MTRYPLTRRMVLAAIGGGMLAPLLPMASAGATAQRLSYGWDPDVEGPTEADLHVALDGDDANPGTAASPLRSIQHAVDLLAKRSSGSIALHGGLYREAVSLDALQGAANPSGPPSYRLHRYGRERVTITAAEPLTGWAPCTAAEAAAIGAPAEGLFIARIAQSRLAHGDPFALNLHERGVWCPMATFLGSAGPSEMMFNPDRFRRAQFETRGEKLLITSVMDLALVGADPELIAQTRLLLYHAPNIVSVMPAAGFDPATGTIFLPQDAKLRMQVTNKEPQMLYALQNMGSALAPGSWAIRPEADQIAVYFHPRDPDALQDGIEISLRGHCVDFGAARGVELFGLEAVRAAGNARKTGVCIRRSVEDRNAPEGADLRLRHCRAGENLETSGNGYGAIFMQGASDLSVTACSVGPCRGSFGLFLNQCRQVDMRGLHITGITKSPARFYTLTQAVLAFSLFEDSGLDAHSNKVNFYQGSDQILVYGLRTRRTGGYATYQRASRIHFAFCEFDCDPAAQNRALVSQNYAVGRTKDVGDGTGDPVPGSRFWYWNLSLLPDRDHISPANSLVLGPAGSTQSHEVHNSLLHGGGFADVYLRAVPKTFEIRSHNAYSGLAYWQAARRGWGLTQGDVMVNPGQSLMGLGKDMRDAIAQHIAPLFPAFQDWDLDIDGKLIDWSRPPIGASVEG